MPQGRVFLQFLSGLAEQMRIHLSVMKNSLTGKREINLPNASDSIGTLAAIHEKTVDNLTAEEDAYLKATRHHLPLYYVSSADE